MNLRSARLALLVTIMSMVCAPAIAQKPFDALQRLIAAPPGSLATALDAFQSIREVSLGLPGGGAPLASDASAGLVVLYRTAVCGFCKLAASHMQARGIAFTERYIDRDEQAKLGHATYRSGGVPVIIMGPTVLRGFAAPAFDKAYEIYAATQMPEAHPRPAAAPSLVAQAPPVKARAAIDLQAGDLLVGKVPGVPVHAQAARGGAPVLRLDPQESVVYSGRSQAGYLHVVGARGEGWVEPLLVKRQD